MIFLQGDVSIALSLLDIANKYGIGYVLFGIICYFLYKEMKMWRQKYLKAIEEGTIVINKSISKHDELTNIYKELDKIVKVISKNDIYKSENIKED